MNITKKEVKYTCCGSIWQEGFNLVCGVKDGGAW